MGNPIATTKTFRGGFFFPWDIGALVGGRLLCITGRQDARVNLGGDKINVELVEAVLAGCEGLLECGVFGVPNTLGVTEIWVALVADPKLQDENLRDYCEKHLGSKLVPAGIVRVDGLPRNRSGKIERSRLAELVKRPL
jgi:acyl-coenzyme A synthetase/AMP-(fatty) acid ligase